MSDVFIIHVEEDADIALETVLGLEEAGYTTWCYELDSVPGPSYLIRTGQAIRQSKSVVLVISPHSLSSHQVTTEVVQAHESGKYFIPLLRDISHVEFQNRQPEWRIAVGSATSIRIPQEGMVSILPRVIDGLKALDILPQAKPDAARIERIRKALGELQRRSILEKAGEPPAPTKKREPEPVVAEIPSAKTSQEARRPKGWGRLALIAFGLVAIIALGVAGAIFLGRSGPSAVPTPAPKPTPTPTISVTFPDKNLEAAIRSALGKPAGEGITEAELAKLTKLDVNEQGIFDLTGIQYCVNLTWLSLHTNKISDISPLASLTKLAGLRLEKNQISDISPLSSLTELTKLGLDGNQIRDIKPLVANNGLSEGDTVSLAGNPLSSSSVDIYIPQLKKRGVSVLGELAPAPAVAQEPDTLFFDDFESGKLTSWRVNTLGGEVSIGKKPDGNPFLDSKGNVSSSVDEGPYWTDYTIKVKVLLLEERAIIRFRVHVHETAQGRVVDAYVVELRQNRILLRKTRSKAGALPGAIPQSTELVSTPVQIEPNTWYTLAIGCQGSEFTVKIDGVTRINYVDKQEPILSGGIALATLEGSHALFDDVYVNKSLSGYPKPSPTPAPTTTQARTVRVDFTVDGAVVEIIVDGKEYQPFSKDVPAGTSITIEAKDPTPQANYRYIFVKWSDGGERKHEVKPTSNTTYTAYYKTQYLLTVVSSYGSVKGGGWYDEGASVSPSVAPTIVVSKGARYTHTGWSLPLPITITGPKRVEAQWKSQYMRVDVMANLSGPGDLRLRNPQTNLQVNTDIPFSSATVDFPDGRSVALKPYTDVFTPQADQASVFRYSGNFPGMPVAGGIYTFIGWDAQGTQVAWNTDIYLGGNEPQPPRNISTSIVKGKGIMVSWQPVPSIGSFEPEKGRGYYQIEIRRADESGGLIFGTNSIRTTPHLVPQNRSDFLSDPRGPQDRGTPLGEITDGTYRISVGALSLAPEGSAGWGVEANSQDPNEMVRFAVKTVSGQKEITILQ